VSVPYGTRKLPNGPADRQNGICRTETQQRRAISGHPADAANGIAEQSGRRLPNHLPDQRAKQAKGAKYPTTVHAVNLLEQVAREVRALANERDRLRLELKRAHERARIATVPARVSRPPIYDYDR
jgi:hypothetical protein